MKKAIFVFIFLFSIFYSNSQNIKKLIGKSFPDNILESKVFDINNNELNFGKMIDSLKGNIVYIDFWASWCRPCIDEMQYSKKMQKYFTGEKLLFLYISTDTENEKWQKGLKKINIAGYHFRLKNESKPAIRKLFKIKGIPYCVIIDSDGKILNPKAKYPSSKKIIREIEQLIKAH